MLQLLLLLLLLLPLQQQRNVRTTAVPPRRMIVVECGDGRAVADTMVRKDDDMVPSCDDQ
jgi:hypothetical protein